MTTLITPLPTPPTRQDSANFNDRADEFLGALPLFQQEANTLAVEANINSQAAASVANVSKWVSGITYSEGEAVWSPITAGAYRRITAAGSGTVDPSLDTTNYLAITGAQSIEYRASGAGAISTTVELKLQESISVKDHGAVGDGVIDDRAAIIAADAAAKLAGKFLYFPSGVYRCSDGIDRTAHWVGEGAPQLAPFPLVGDDKQYLRPGYKYKIPGAVLLFTGTGTKTATTQRSDSFASFTYCVKDSTTGLHMKDLAIVLDCNIYDAGGVLTAYGSESSAVYGVGHYIDDAAQCLRQDVVVFGYFQTAGTVVRSTLGNDDPDYNIFRGGSTMGRVGFALIGSEVNDAFDSGMSGTMSYGMDIFTLDHHSRNSSTAATIYADADSWSCVYIDGFVDASTTRLNGHYFFGGSIRTYAIHPVVFDCASQINFIGCAFESSNYVGVPNAATKQWLATSETFDVGITNCRFSTDVGLFNSSFGGGMKGQLTVVNSPGLSAGGGIIVSESSAGVAHWLKVGGASGNSGDPAIQFGSGAATNSTSGWSIRRDISDSDMLDFRFNGTSLNTMTTTGGFGRLGYAVGPTRTIAAGVITVTNFSYYRVANEGAAATDDLVTINGGLYDGQILILAAAASDQDVVLKDGTGNLRLSADFTLTHAQDRITLQFDGVNWCEISRSDNTV